MIDTTADAAAIVLAAKQRIAPIQRMRDALTHSETMRELALSRLRLIHPGRTTLELVELLREEATLTDSPPQDT